MSGDRFPAEVANDINELLDRLQGGPSQVDDLETSVAASLARYRLYKGQFYEAGYLFEKVKDDTVRRIFIDNPSDSGVLVDISSINIDSDGKVNITSTFNVTEDSQGTEITVRNKDGSLDGEVIEIRRGGTYSGGVDSINFTLPGGVGETSVGTTIQTQFNLLRPGNSLLIEMQNDAGRSEDQSFRIEYTEVPD